MNQAILKEAINRCREQQPLNRQKENVRQEEVFQKSPKIAELFHQRREAILSVVRSAFSSEVSPNLLEETKQRSEAIEKELKALGYPDNYLDPQFTCKLCEDSGYVGEKLKELCPCVKKTYEALVAQQYQIPDTLQSFETFDENVFYTHPLPGLGISQQKLMVTLRNRLERYADALPAPPVPHQLFYGKTGLGKTFLMQCIAKRAKEKNLSALMITANRLLNLIRRDYFSQGDEDGMYMVTNADVLLIDDLGTEPLLKNITIEQFFALIDERFTLKKPTVFSTNLSLTELQGRYTERITSRLFDESVCEKTEFLGDDLRKRNNQKK